MAQGHYFGTTGKRTQARAFLGASSATNNENIDPLTGQDATLRQRSGQASQTLTWPSTKEPSGSSGPQCKKPRKPLSDITLEYVHQVTWSSALQVPCGGLHNVRASSFKYHLNNVCIEKGMR